MNKIFFLVDKALEGEYTAKAIGESIFTEGDNIGDLNRNIVEAIECHFNGPNLPHFKLIFAPHS